MENCALAQTAVNLAFQFTFAPVPVGRQSQVELTLNRQPCCYIFATTSPHLMN
jgi:hypothetical protein